MTLPQPCERLLETLLQEICDGLENPYDKFTGPLFSPADSSTSQLSFASSQPRKFMSLEALTDFDIATLKNLEDSIETYNKTHFSNTDPLPALEHLFSQTTTGTNSPGITVVPNSLTSVQNTVSVQETPRPYSTFELSQKEAEVQQTESSDNNSAASSHKEPFMKFELPNWFDPSVDVVEKTTKHSNINFMPPSTNRYRWFRLKVLIPQDIYDSVNRESLLTHGAPSFCEGNTVETVFSKLPQRVCYPCTTYNIINLSSISFHKLLDTAAALALCVYSASNFHTPEQEIRNSSQNKSPAYRWTARGKYTITLAVPRNIVGSLIGVNGECVQELRAKLGTRIYISPLQKSIETGLRERLIQITSKDSESGLTALQRILEHCCKHTQAESDGVSPTFNTPYCSANQRTNGPQFNNEKHRVSRVQRSPAEYCQQYNLESFSLPM